MSKFKILFRNALLTIIAFVIAGAKLEKVIPAEMIFVKGGKFQMGSNDGFEDEKPVHSVFVKTFLMDKYLTSVSEFRSFVNKTNYETDAEKFGNSIVFDFKNKEWQMMDKANWEFPFGPGEIKASDNLPVTQVSWRDAMAYCKWKHKRLPSEAEWEYAARNGGKPNEKYSWGDQLVINGKYYANIWTGDFPDTNTLADGFQFTSPVGKFPPSKNGLYDMGGNVWEWCSDSYHLYSEEVLNDSVKVVRGGSFMCDSNVCHGYRVSARMHTTFESATLHTGFRCACDWKQ